VNHTIQAFVSSDSQNNVWDDGYPSGGNYWSNYAGADTKNGPNQNLSGSDNIGDRAYTINSNNKDNYPLMNAWNPITFDVNIAGNPVPITVTTNTTITNTGSTPNTLVFTASGPTGTSGYVLVIIPVGLNNTDILVTIDGVPPSTPYPIITTDGTDYFVYFRFDLSSHQIQLVIGAPELPVPAVPMGTLAATVAMILVLAAYFTITKRKREHAEMPNPGHSVDSCALRSISMDGGASSSEQN
jgi:hypothetical protein